MVQNTYGAAPKRNLIITLQPYWVFFDRFRRVHRSVMKVNLQWLQEGVDGLLGANNLCPSVVVKFARIEHEEWVQAKRMVA